MSKLNRKQTAAIVFAIAAIFALFPYLNPQQTESKTLKILCAGSLLNPLNAVAEAYMKDNPSVNVYIEGHGSIQVIRHHTEMNDTADILMVADYALIPTMMYFFSPPGSSINYTDWYLRFAGNRLVLGYSNLSRHQEELNSTNWHKILLEPDVKIGFPNPLIDALGYRSLMVVQLIEKYYNQTNYFKNLVSDNFEVAFKTVELADKTVIFVPEIIEPLNDKISFRASSVQLIPLLESGSVDYCFLYRSNAEQYGLNYLELPEEMNMGNSEFDDIYDNVMIRYQHQRFSSIGVDRFGGTIYYGLTIPVDALNPELAEDFIKYLLIGEGKTIFKNLNHPIYQPTYSDNIESTPEGLRSLLINDP